MAALFVFAVFLSAWLLFSIQPMAAKWLLPFLGGSPSVWIVCMLFFQTTLVAGYGYAYLLTRLRGVRIQLALHGVLLLVALSFVPVKFAIGSGDPVLAPVAWLLRLLASGLGLPLVVLSASGPMLQHWYASSGRRDPYFLYAASNLGSLGALLAYPLVLEPRLPLVGPVGPTQNSLWATTFLAFVGVTLVCAAVLIPRVAARTAGDSGMTRGNEAAKARPSWRDRAIWAALAAVPSSAVLGTTQVITSDIAAVPLLWVIPLAVYLLTFIIAFARPAAVPTRIVSWGLLACVLAVGVLRWVEFRPRPLTMIALLLATLFVLAYACHDRLSRGRPDPERLTEFYFWIAVGGVVGGAFNAVVAPSLFASILEYPVVLVLAVAMFPPWRSKAGRNWLGRLGSASAVGALFVAGAVAAKSDGELLFAERTFFGVLRVELKSSRPFHVVEDGKASGTQTVHSHDLYHGTTRHGRQMIEPGVNRWGASYYHPTGPIGRLFRAFRGTGELRQVALIGLGVGALASYGEPGQSFTFYEIDPEVVRIAKDPALFTYLRDSRADVRVRIGDGRLLLSREQDRSFDLIVLDGFTSDAIPVHLLTREALMTYLAKLGPDGLLALHLSNQHFDLVPVVRALAADLGLGGIQWHDRQISPRDEVEGKSPSEWVVLASQPTRLDRVRANGGWAPLAPGPRTRVWTDTYSSPLSVLRP